ncbi:MAG: rhodanese-like domain-containing protein [Acidimicrobiia bacterium]|nr:rhodanese-like domain-containing protein [Acidimicrobiia bacterium]
MIFEQHYLDCLSQASYVIGDESSKRAVVVDPRRDVAPYLETAREHDLTIELVIETHFHADFLSGHLELAEATGAVIAYGSRADTEFESRKLAHGERVELGEIVLEIRHTPGHTPESISVVVFEHADDDVPYAVLTGDTLFIGDVGRPDLLSSKGVTSEELASHLYDSLHEELLTLPNETRVYPAHGAGSACGKNLSTDTWSTIGDERETNYALAPMSKDDFIAAVTEGQTAPPAYFAFDATLNRELRPILDERAVPAALTIDETIRHQRRGAVVLDTRDPVEFARGHLIGSVNIGMAGRYAEFAGGVIQPGAPIVLVAEPGLELEAKNRLGRIGFDNVVGHLADPLRAFHDNPAEVVTSSRVDVAGLTSAIAEVDGLQLVDVRQPGETEAGVIDGAILVPLTRLNERLATLDASKPTIVYCAGGFRSSIAASRMAAEGFADVSDLLGGYDAWATAKPAPATG